MLFKVITASPFSLNGITDAHYKQGEVMEINDVARAEFLIRNEIAEPFDVPSGGELTEEIDPSKPLKDAPVSVAIIEANGFDSKATLFAYANSEHEIKLDKRKSLPNMKAEFEAAYGAKMEAIESHNEEV